MKKPAKKTNPSHLASPLLHTPGPRPNTPRPAPPTHSHHAWSSPGEAQPRIVSITTAGGPHIGTLARIRGPRWIFDYEWEPYGRIGTGTGPTWRDRPSQTLHLYPPNTDFWEDVRGVKGARDSAWIFFDDATGTLDRFLDPAQRYRRIEDPTGQIGDWFRELSELGRTRGDESFWHANAILLRLFDAVVHAQAIDPRTLRFDPGTNQRLESRSLFHQVEQFLKPRLGDPVRVSDIARHLHLSESSLAHRLRAEAGVTPMALLARLRVDQAKSLLVRGVPLKTIAPILGFCDEFHLSRTIKRLEGKSPRELRTRVD